MEDELKRMMKENLALARENNRLLKKMQRAAMYSTIFTLVYWVLILGVPVYLYFTVVKPYLEEFQTTYQDAQARMDGLPDMPDFNAFFPFLEKTEEME